MKIGKRIGLATIAITAIVTTGVTQIETTSVRAATQPNVVVIMTDDQWFDSMSYMPKTNALLAATGVTFSNFHVSNPLC